MDYLIWHYSRGLKNAFLLARNLVKFYWKLFSISLLARTIFSPWRKDITFANWRGLHPLLFLNKLFNNVFSRFMGALARITIICLGLLAEIITLAITPVILICWILLPVLLLFSFLFFVSVIFRIGAYGIFTVISSGAFLFFLLLFSAVSVRSFLYHKKYGEGTMEEKTLEELSDEKWFLRVWNRMGFVEEQESIKNNFSNEKILEKELQNIGLSLENFNSIIEWEKKREKKREKKTGFGRRKI